MIENLRGLILAEFPDDSPISGEEFHNRLETVFTKLEALETQAEEDRIKEKGFKNVYNRVWMDNPYPEDTREHLLFNRGELDAIKYTQDF